MLRSILLAGAAAAALIPAAAHANDRYRERPPLVVSPDLSAPWVMQLQRAPSGRAIAAPAIRREQAVRRVPQLQREPIQRRVGEPRVQTAAIVAPQRQKPRLEMNPIYLPTEVEFASKEKPGTIIIDQESKFLYFIRGDGKARRYGVGVGKEGMDWRGVEKVSNKREWPDWRPPAEMIAREKKKGRILPVHMPGGPENPLGARALYLGDTLYRIHGTNAPWTIGTNNSSGCIRMRNEDVVELYEMVSVGAKVIVR